MSLVLALSLGLLAAEPGLPAAEHRVRLEHGGTVVDAHYRTRVLLVSQQTGTVSKVGTPSTLRCVWRADVRIDRQATSGPAVRLARGIAREGVLTGHHAGWCGAHRAAIAREVARRGDAIQADLLEVAQEDETVLRAELDQARPG
jgi:hypothetical protein